MAVYFRANGNFFFEIQRPSLSYAVIKHEFSLGVIILLFKYKCMALAAGRSTVLTLIRLLGKESYV